MSEKFELQPGNHNLAKPGRSKNTPHINVDHRLQWIINNMQTKDLVWWAPSYSQIAFGTKDGDCYYEVSTSIRDGVFFLKTFEHSINAIKNTKNFRNHSGANGYTMTQDEIISALKDVKIVIENL
jgi:hypothetical protein